MDNNFGEKLDKIYEIVNNLNGKIQSIDATIKEREKSEILRNEVLLKSIEAQDKSMVNICERVRKLEDNQGKVVWLVISMVIASVLGVILI